MFLVKIRIMLMHHLLYSPDQAQHNFILFPKLKNSSQVRFEVSEKSTIAQFHSKSKYNFQRCFDLWKTKQNKCAKCQENYLNVKNKQKPMNYLKQINIDIVALII